LSSLFIRLPLDPNFAVQSITRGDFEMNGIRVSILALLFSICQAEMIPALRGRVESDSPFLGTEYSVQLEDRTRNGPRYDASVQNDGSFEIRDVPGGQYSLRLMTLRGDTVCEQFLDLHQFTGQILIPLPSRRSSQPGSGTVSVRDLQRPIPEKAFRFFLAAQRDIESGRELDAVRQLERALQVYPEYSDARCNLGVEYVRLGRHQEALEQFEKAAASGPASAKVYANLAYSLCLLGRLADAEQAARRAVEIDSSYSRAHYMLGSILAKSVIPGSLAKAPEAAHQLRLGAADIPHAFLDIAQIYLAEGDPLSAAEEVRLYLKCGEKGYRADAERWLARLLQN
jgi:tetratricopeptide (TPR) repeat protein